LEEIMPYKPRRPCAHPGCPALTDKRFCPAHAQADARDYSTRRDPETNRRYGGASV
jgi:5-methylcytosine-specific restriction protein A